jgi:hypothetical protein
VLLFRVSFSGGLFGCLLPGEGRERVSQAKPSVDRSYCLLRPGPAKQTLHMVVGFSFFPSIYGSRQVRRCRDFMDIFTPRCLRIRTNKYTACVDKEASRLKSSNGNKSLQ